MPLFSTSIPHILKAFPVPIRALFPTIGTFSDCMITYPTGTSPYPSVAGNPCSHEWRILSMQAGDTGIPTESVCNQSMFFTMEFRLIKSFKNGLLYCPCSCSSDVSSLLPKETNGFAPAARSKHHLFLYKMQREEAGRACLPELRRKAPDDQ